MSGQPRSLPVAFLSVAVYVGLVLAIFLAVLHRTGGSFVYALDDPYIHLAMAEQIAHGHYGIDPSEASSPSSSLVWPFLLTPFTGHAAQVYLPFAWNFLFGIAAAALIGMFVDDLPLASASPPLPGPVLKGVLAILLIFIANLASLTFLGMEHVLQVLLSISCAIGMTRALQDKPIPMWCLAAAVLGPSVRYENLALTVAITIALVGLCQIRAAAVVLVLSVLPLLAFSFFLHSLGLPALPTSVLMKSDNNINPQGTHSRLLQTLAVNVRHDFQIPERLALLLLMAVLLVFLYYTSRRMNRVVLFAVGVVVGAQLLIGKFGWFYRYQVYAMIFTAIVLLRIAAEMPRFRFIPTAAVLLLCASPFLHATALTPFASQQVYEQQFQMQRFEDSVFRQDIAVNDIGLVSYRRPPGVHVLDLYGLASPEVSREPHRTASWLQNIVQRHDIRLAIIYPDWFIIPPDWSNVATMCRTDLTPITGFRCVSFYSTAPGTLSEVRADVARFSATLPPSVKMTLF